MRTWTKTEDGNYTERILEHHRCTKEELAQFAPPTIYAEATLNKYLTDPKKGMFCVDYEKLDEDLTIWGQGLTIEDTFKRLELIMTPCQYLHTYTGYEGDSIHKDCIADKA